MGTEGPAMSQLQALRLFVNRKCLFLVGLAVGCWNRAFRSLWAQRVLVHCPSSGSGAACAELQCKLHLCLLV